MKFVSTELEGAWIIEPERRGDDRGFFARTWCRREFARHGLNPDLVQCNISFNRIKGTVRGMHFQHPPHEETKIVRCTAGAILDVIVDLRRRSPTFLCHIGVRLDAATRNSLYVPAGFAHGFQTLANDTEVFYQMPTPYHPESAAGIRWDDPALRIEWPLPIKAISKKDLEFPLYNAAKEYAPSGRRAG